MNETTNNLTCAFHPRRETRLRCNRCDKPICIQCARHTPTGYRCPECIKTQQKVFITAKWQDYIIAVLISGMFSFGGSLLATVFSFFTIFLAPLVGAGTVVVIKKLISNRRSPRLSKTITATALVASLPVALIQLVRVISLLLAYGIQASSSLLSLVWVIVYSIMVTSTIYYRLH